MNIHIYLSLIPECLVASMLDPAQFGNYYAIGSKKRSRGQAIFFEVDPQLAGAAIDWDTVNQRCVPHEDGSPRKSTYLRIYRALESIPTLALKTLYLATDDGRVLGIEPAPFTADASRLLHLYQELCPVSPRVVSKLDPLAFCRRLTDPAELVNVPRLVFTEMKLEALANNPDAANVDNLPYSNIEHLRDCLREVSNVYAKPNKQVLRQVRHDVLYRTIRGGFYVGDQESFLYFPLPSPADLESKHYAWWRSALTTFGA
jgi:hypothetical protein